MSSAASLRIHLIWDGGNLATCCLQRRPCRDGPATPVVLQRIEDGLQKPADELHTMLKKLGGD